MSRADVLALIRNLPPDLIAQMQDLLGVRNSRDSSPPPALRSYGSEDLGIFFNQVLAEYAHDSLKAELTSRAWKEIDKALFAEAFNSIKPEGDRLKSKMARLFWEELLDFHTPKQPHRAVEELKKKPALEARDKALREFQDHSLRPLRHTVLHHGMRSMEEFPSSHAEAIEDLKEMRHLSRLVALYFSVHSQTSVRLAARCARRSCPMLSASRSTSFGPSSSLFFDRARGLLEAAVTQRTWEREFLPKTAPRGGDKPRNRLPRMRSRT